MPKFTMVRAFPNLWFRPAVTRISSAISPPFVSWLSVSQPTTSGEDRLFSSEIAVAKIDDDTVVNREKTRRELETHR